jgi:serine protease AprX
VARKVVSAEVTVEPEKAREAALSLQKIGFRIRHVGTHSVSAEGAPELWDKTFRVALRESTQKRDAKGLRGDERYFESTAPVVIPDELANVVKDVAFVRPPQLY